MTCAKQTVVAIIKNNGKVWFGTNWCENPQRICPRSGMKTGEGYDLCKSICEQVSHAEVMACKWAQAEAEGGTMIIYGHAYVCDDCKRVAREYGIREIKFA